MSEHKENTRSKMDDHKKQKKNAADTPRKKSGVRRLISALLGVLFGVVLMGVAIVIFVNIWMVSNVGDRIITIDEAAALSKGSNPPQCIEVLGASLRNGSPSPILAKRIDTGMEAYAAGASNVLLFSGDNGTNEYNEVTAMRAYALENADAYDLIEESVVLDYAGFSTYESMYRLREVFQVDSAVVVTQEYHLYRALYIANRLGIDAYGIAAPGQEEGQFRRDIREMLARTKDFFYVMFDVQPTYLGDPIELPNW
jgi:vancomycin permeability regulator SanA